MKIRYLTGSIFDLLPYTSKTDKLLIHCCNDAGGFGSGFVVPLMRKWPKTKQIFKECFESKSNCYLGNNQFIRVQAATEESGDIEVVNMIGQHNVIGMDPTGRPPVRYVALSNCMQGICNYIRSKEQPNYEIYGPLFGAKLAGGNWDFIEELLIEHFIDKGIPVTICQMPGEELRPSENV